MTLLIIAVFVALVAAGSVVYPIAYGKWGLLGDATSSAVADKSNRKRNALTALKEAQYDHAAGKLDDADYAAMRRQLEMEAVEAVRDLDTEESRIGIAGSTEHACGFINPGGSRFCAGCGHRLT